MRLLSNDFEFVSYRKEVEQQMEEIAARGMEKVLMLIRSAAKSLTPVNTGQLRDRLDYQLRMVNGKVVGIVGSPDMYAIYVEFGTGEFAENGSGRKGGWAYQDPSGEWFFTWGQDPQPFLRPAFKQNKKQIIDILGKEYRVNFKGGK